MTYFKNFPQDTFDLYGDGASSKLAKNILVRIKMRESFQKMLYVYDDYVVRDGERPENVSYKLYGTTDYYWILLFVNQIIDPAFEWPMSYLTFNRFIERKYGSIATAKSTVHEYKEENGYVIDAETYATLPATERSIVYKYDYEEDLNFQRSLIKVVQSFYVAQLSVEFRDLLKNTRFVTDPLTV